METNLPYRRALISAGRCRVVQREKVVSTIAVYTGDEKDKVRLPSL